MWHYPILIFADYNAGTPTWYSLTCFSVMVIGLGFVFAWMRLKSGSLWTGVVLHASHNLFIQAFFDPITTDTGKTKYITSEFGAALAVTVLVVAAYFLDASRRTGFCTRIVDLAETMTMTQLTKLFAAVCAGALLASAQTPIFRYQEVMIPMRDGIHLQTAIITPVDQKAPLPILLTRTPYGVPDKAPTSIAPNLVELMADGYILVYQNLRGRFKSEGVFKLSSQVNLADPKDTNETTDAYDTIDWLVKNLPNNNGRVGIYGVSYAGLTAGLDAAASASGAEGRFRASLARRPMDERRQSSLRRSAAELHVRILGDGAGRQEREHAFQLRHLRFLRVVSEAGSGVEHQFEVGAQFAAVSGMTPPSIPITTRSGSAKRGSINCIRVRCPI